MSKIRISLHHNEYVNAKDYVGQRLTEELTRFLEREFVRPAAMKAIVASGEVGAAQERSGVNYFQDMRMDNHVWEFDLTKINPKLFTPETPISHQDLVARWRKRVAELRETASIQNDRLADELEEILDNG